MGAMPLPLEFGRNSYLQENEKMRWIKKYKIWGIQGTPCRGTRYPIFLG